jgi:hypothetical protein
MAFITQEYYQELKKNKMIERNDYTNLSKQSREVGLKDGKGYSRQTFRNVLEKGFTTIPEMVELILNYYTPKAEALKKQRESIHEMKKKLATPLQ